MYANAMGAVIGLSAIVEALLLAAFFVGCYLVTKMAVREGIRESGLIEALTRANRTSPPTRRKWANTEPGELPDMRAER